MEQPPQEDFEEPISPPEQPSNVVRGPWQEESHPALPISEIPPAERPANVIEGPWQPKSSELEFLPPAESKPALPKEEQAVTIQALKAELNTLEQQQKENDDRKIEVTYTRFRPCEACGGSGRRWYVLNCQVCGGLGSIPADTQKTVDYVGG